MGSRWESFPSVETQVGNKKDRPIGWPQWKEPARAPWNGQAKKRGVGFLHSSLEAPAVVYDPLADLFFWPTLMKKYISCYRVICGRVHLKCPASLENLEALATLGPYSQGQLLARAEQLPTSLPRDVHSGSLGFPLGGSFSFCFSIHSPSKAFQFESTILTLRSDLVGGGRNLLIGPRTSGAPYPGCTILRTKIKDENLPLCQL